MPVFDSRSFNDHEQVVFCRDPATGLKGIIAVHSTALGPATGGCRFWDYTATHLHVPLDVAQTRAEQDAVYDVLRLSRGMSYKNAMAGLRLGGGKSVIIGDPAKLGTPELMRAFGRHVQRLGGTYYAAEDVGTSPGLLSAAAEASEYVVGLEEGSFATGDPSPHTAKGVYAGIKAAVRHKLGRDSLDGLTVAVQGVGNVGRYLCGHLAGDGARLIIADISEANIAKALEIAPAEVVAPDTIHTAQADVFAPCALGGGINSQTIPELKAGVVAGAANNQLEHERADDEALRKRSILYAPDYVINAGGIISVESEVYRERLDDAARADKVAHIGDTLMEIFQTADREGRPTGVIANELAEARIAKARQAKLQAAAE